jgi:hypothetical protein
MLSRSLIARLVTAISCALPLASGGQTLPAAAPSPSPSPAASVTDPCTSLTNLISRPTFSTAACVVKFADLLIQTGYTNVTTSGRGANSALTYPQANLSVGLGKNLEFDFVPESFARYSGTPGASGSTDSAIGFKYELGYSRKAIVGVNVLYTLATGSAPFSGFGDGLLASANASYALSSALGLFASFGYNVQSAGAPGIPARYHDFQPSLGTSLALPQDYTVFVEGFNQSSTAVGLGGRYAFDTGLQKDVGSRLQLDFNYFDYFGAQNGGRQHSLGFGASYLVGS